MLSIGSLSRWVQRGADDRGTSAISGASKHGEDKRTSQGRKCVGGFPYEWDQRSPGNVVKSAWLCGKIPPT